jgi:hypothetical protein
VAAVSAPTTDVSRFESAGASARAVVEVEPAAPRELTSKVRKQIGLPLRAVQPYSWPRAWVFSLGFGVPLALAGYYKTAVVLSLLALVFLPIWRKFEHRTATAGEDIYRLGLEAIGRIVDNEPAGNGRRDHLTRVEYLVGDTLITARVVGAPLARKGLQPGQLVRVLHDRKEPSRALIIERVAADAVAKHKAPPAPTAEELAEETKTGGCGGGGCGAGGCGGGGCGGGACGGGGCGSGGCGGGGC